MKTIYSIGLWAAGGLFFLFSALILMICLHTLSRETTFRTARFLFSIVNKIMGIRLGVTGRENIDQDQSYLIMGNHQSLFDIFVLPPAIPLCFVAVEASYHFSLPIWGYLVRKWGCIPIERHNLKNAISSLETARKTLMDGTSIAILPEGHRTRTGKMAPFKKGPFHLAIGARATILPFGIAGLYDYNPKAKLLLCPGRVAVNIGRPIPYESYKNLSVEEIRDEVFQSVLLLSRGNMPDG